MLKKINFSRAVFLLFTAVPGMQANAAGFYHPPAFFPQPYHPAHYAVPPMPYMMPHGGYYPVYPDQQATAAAENPYAENISPSKALPAKVEQKAATPQKSSTTHKQQFIEKLLPYIEKENIAILEQRNWLIKAFRTINSGQPVSSPTTAKINALTKKYRVTSANADDKEMQQALLAKVDIIPASLTLAQAANESAWGKSRFAREANNLFGIWTYDPDKGLKPKNRDKNKKHFVRKFDDIGQSVRYYMHMLNSHPAYAELRQIRLGLRNQDKEIQGSQLAQGLEKYSAKGEIYITLIIQLITQNQWASLDSRQTQA